jgi:hypothetical protein
MRRPKLPRRLPPRFSLRTLFALVTLVSVWLAYETTIVRKRRQLRRDLEAVVANRWNACNTVVGYSGDAMIRFSEAEESSIPWLRRIFGDKPATAICLPAAMTDEQAVEYKRYFPEARFSQFVEEGDEPQ